MSSEVKLKLRWRKENTGFRPNASRGAVRVECQQHYAFTVVSGVLKAIIGCDQSSQQAVAAPVATDAHAACPLPPLSPLRELACIRGPHPRANYVIPGMLIQGSWPTHRGFSPSECHDALRSLAAAGVDVFVNLVTVREVRSSANYLQEYQLLRDNTQQLQLPIVDGQIAADDKLLKLATKCRKLLEAGNVLYVHCYGGHGRAGTLCALLLGQMYRIGGEEALERIQAYHDTRGETEEAQGLNASPAAACQSHQVRRLLKLY